MQNSDNIATMRPDVNGAAWVADVSAKTPTSATEELSGFDGLGWLTEDGITMTVNKETTDLKGFGGDTALTIQTGHDVEFKFTPMEWNEVVAKEMFGDSNVGDDAESVIINGDDLPIKQYVFDMRGRGAKLYRVVVPRMKMASFGDIPFKHNAPLGAEFTMKALPDDSGNKVYIYVAESKS